MARLRKKAGLFVVWIVEADVRRLALNGGGLDWERAATLVLDEFRPWLPR
jgi:hypothetical protein